MIVSETYSAIGDAIRKQYGTIDKYKLGDMPKMIDSLEIHNFLDEGQSLEAGVDSNMKSLSGITMDVWNKYLLGQTVVLSFDVEWSNYKEDAKYRNRFGFEILTQAEDGSWHYNGVWLSPHTESGKQHVTTTWKIFDKKISALTSSYLYNQVNDNTKLKITNPKFVINPLGGVTRVNLLSNHEIRYLPKNNPSGNFDCYIVYKDTPIKMEYGKRYEVVAETNGVFSNQHQPNVESDKCVLWLTDNTVYTQPISDEHTAQGTVFTWGGPTGTYYLRVNAYHKSTTNTIYAYNIRIYEA